MKNNLLIRLNALKYEGGGSMVIIPKGITARIEEYANQREYIMNLQLWKLLVLE